MIYYQKLTYRLESFIEFVYLKEFIYLYMVINKLIIIYKYSPTYELTPMEKDFLTQSDDNFVTEKNLKNPEVFARIKNFMNKENEK